MEEGVKKKESFKDKRVTVMGLGLFGGGLGVTRFLVSQGADVTVTDLKSADELSYSLQSLEGLPVRFHLGKHLDEDFSDVDLVIGNPAVPKGSRFLQIAHDNEIPIDTELNIFFRYCPAPITGITGSNGKSTTTTLLGEMLKRSGIKTWVGGNIGVSLLEHVDEIAPDDAVVLELSSFQLEDLGKTMLSPRISIITNIVPNHLDRHKTLEEYVDAKKSIIRFQDRESYAILNDDDPLVKEWADECKGTVLRFSVTRRLEQGAFLNNSEIIFNSDAKECVISGLSEMPLKGFHNVQNILAAACAAKVMGADSRSIEETIKSFSGLEHRLEFVKSIQGVVYYNDSKATTPEAAIAAIRAFSNSREFDKSGGQIVDNSTYPEKGVIVIAGGYDKGVNLGQFAQECAKGAKCVILMGDTAETILQLIKDTEGVKEKPEVYIETSLDGSLLIASRIAQSGDVVLLSPACASYGMFTNYEERGSRFKDLVGRLAIGTA
ncbi:MAG: UDP-N-acetylmuramoyl-L-alanine--D-glutamate ligase [Candidatus Scalindua sp. AMX11]|nr:MAG: UDP-N-acetylmuramoyl-L-alanine--D-glutamate ligase [Candidatus Scalindua sp.]NOG84836.1 UDP-N-acetylmuramoyl-L-alanine--D-glutamate ligase [Planctomycetota bacterium]RZV61720.1 MAG: UDP-N-acetylmuramoyl-L-alanine--D-glutamate ligase [Candidatus Scalindua sp. SCAELEC01]TDE63270.1 MAG: UDP-N-acetylmuramoyl-L-alanine--D-glutamate ligase [Candidatus Scalindua sp. AMX11]GJQ60931.1 MAG: UDP-N-acetylmuramoylalanine--D-glutamate ligase [Candidatus Scalindua sp.]